MNSGKFSESDYKHLSEFRRRLRLFLRFSEEQARANGIRPNSISFWPLRAVTPITRRSPSARSPTRCSFASRALRSCVNRCVKRGLLHRQEDPRDRRRVIVWLTDDGQTILDRVTDANREAARDAALSDAVAQAFIDHMPGAVGQGA